MHVMWVGIMMCGL